MNVTPRSIRAIVIVHTVSTWFMVGMIWTIHHVHYPLFAEVGEATYESFQSAHVERIGQLLLVPWLTEGLTLLLLIWAAFLGGRRELRWAVSLGAVAMAVVLAVSGIWSAPAHGELMDGFDPEIHDRLMTANLVRAVAWSVRGVTAVWIVSLVWPKPDSPTQPK